MARVSEETKQLLVSIVDRATAQQHHCLFQAKVARQKQAIIKLKALLAECHLFGPRDDADKTSHDGMFQLMSKVQESILPTEEVGTCGTE